MRIKVLVLALVVSATCADPLPPVYDVVGNWSGYTGQKKSTQSSESHPFSFKVDTGGVVSFDVTIDIKGVSNVCDVFGGYHFGNGASGPFAITRNRFNASRRTAGTITFNITGEFASSTQASGTLQGAHDQCGTAQTTWTATKNP